YSYSDIQVGTTVQYYRLKMVDRDGQFTYSPVQRLSAVEAKEKAWLHPNPVQGSIIKVELPRLPSSPLSYTLINSAGIIVQQGLLRDKVEQLNVEALAKGIYLLQLANGEALKFRKE
ncbi:MAG TPA: T9SS type A sorting domain-containing protein, partial [Flavisolibacter sp.]